MPTTPSLPPEGLVALELALGALRLPLGVVAPAAAAGWAQHTPSAAGGGCWLRGPCQQGCERHGGREGRRRCWRAT
jgi:hypothetical protein